MARNSFSIDSTLTVMTFNREQTVRDRCREVHIVNDNNAHLEQTVHTLGPLAHGEIVLKSSN